MKTGKIQVKALEDFIAICLAAMQQIHEELDL